MGPPEATRTGREVLPPGGFGALRGTDEGLKMLGSSGDRGYPQRILTLEFSRA